MDDSGILAVCPLLFRATAVTDIAQRGGIAAALPPAYRACMTFSIPYVEHRHAATFVGALNGNTRIKQRWRTCRGAAPAVPPRATPAACS